MPTMTTTATKPISQAEMARHTARLNRAYSEEIENRIKDRDELGFTINDLAILTGWTKTYFFRLIKDKRIPKPTRSKTMHGGHRVLRWTEEQARQVLAFHEQQGQRFG